MNIGALIGSTGALFGSISALIGSIVIGVVGSLIAAYVYDVYAKKRGKGDFKVENVALQIFSFAISMVPEEDRAEYYNQWLGDLLSLGTSADRIRFASGLPQAAFILRTRVLVSIPYVVITKQVNSVMTQVDLSSILRVAFVLTMGLGVCFSFYMLIESILNPPVESTWCYNQDWRRITCDTTHRLDNINHPW
jgi:hypothetical protein